MTRPEPPGAPAPTVDVEELLEQWRESGRDGPQACDDDFWGVPPSRGFGVRRWVAMLTRWRFVAPVIGVLLLAFFGVVVARLLADEPGAIPSDSVEAAALAEPGGAGGAAEPVTAPPAAPDWLSIMRSVDQARLLAWQRGDAALLRAVFSAGGPALERERRVVERLVEGDITIRGWKARVLGVRELRASGTDRVIAVTDRRSSYQWRVGEGAWNQQPAADRETWRVTMRSLGGVWLIWDVQPFVP